jgi:hypothetical protein
VVQAPNDKQQLAPMLDKISALPDQLGEAETLLADSGYFSEANVDACAAASIEPLIPQGRQTHCRRSASALHMCRPRRRIRRRLRPWRTG